MHGNFCYMIFSKPQLTRVAWPLFLMKSSFDCSLSLRRGWDDLLQIIIINLVILKLTTPLVSTLLFFMRINEIIKVGWMNQQVIVQIEWRMLSYYGLFPKILNILIACMIELLCWFFVSGIFDNYREMVTCIEEEHNNL